MSRTFSHIPSREDERAIRKLELQEKTGSPLQLASKFFGHPYCPLCGLKLQTKKARSRSMVFRVVDGNGHWFELSFEGRFKVFKQIAKQD